MVISLKSRNINVPSEAGVGKNGAEERNQTHGPASRYSENEPDIVRCAASGALATGALGAEARADGPTTVSGTGYQLWFIGAQRETIMNGKLAAALDLTTLAGRAHLYGLGPLEQLRGEVTIADNRPALARVAPDGTVSVTRSFAAGAPFFVWAEVPRWITTTIPAEVRSFEDLERFVP